MRKYWEILKSQIQIQTAYAAWFWANTASSILRMLILFYFWHAVYANRSEIEGMSLEMMITYAIIAMILGQYVSGVGNELAGNIRDGSVAIELMRPYDLLTKLVAIQIGISISSLVRDTIPILIIAFLFLGLNPPASLLHGGLFAISMLLGILVGTLFDLIVGVLAFWTVNVWGLRVLKEAVILFFTGALIPITLFPDWLERLSMFLPFQSMVFVPVSIYTGMIDGSEALAAIGIQLFWILATTVIVRVFWAIAIRKVTIFGG